MGKSPGVETRTMPKWTHGRADRSGSPPVEAGERVADICRVMGISQATYYLRKRQYAGLGVSELRELRQFVRGERRLKRLVADLSVVQRSCRRLSQESCKARVRRKLARWAQEAYRISERRTGRSLQRAIPPSVRCDQASAIDRPRKTGLASTA